MSSIPSVGCFMSKTPTPHDYLTRQLASLSLILEKHQRTHLSLQDVNKLHPREGVAFDVEASKQLRRVKVETHAVSKSDDEGGGGIHPRNFQHRAPGEYLFGVECQGDAIISSFGYDWGLSEAEVVMRP